MVVRATGSRIGHGLEAQFIMNVALAAVVVGRGKLFAPADATDPFERPMAGTLKRLLVTSVGHWRGEGLGLVEAID
jgi:3-oxoacyl-[acyl-carrier-protein] synthase II